MYENDSDDDEDDDAVPKGPNPKLAQGADLPKRYGEFPLEMASVPICDIDPYYKDQLTFIVIKKGGGIIRYSANPSFFLFSPFHPIRRLAISIFSHGFFDFFIISTILANCYVMMLPDSPNTAASEIIFTAIYTFEAMVKLSSRGFFIRKLCYNTNYYMNFSIIFLLQNYIEIAPTKYFYIFYLFTLKQTNTHIYVMLGIGWILRSSLCRTSHW